MRTALVVLAIGSLSLSGCGTFADKISGPISDHVYYRGVRLDVLAVKEGGPMVLMAADLPFSAVADTLLVPYLAYHELTDPPRKSAQPVIDGQATREQREADSLPQATPKK